MFKVGDTVLITDNKGAIANTYIEFPERYVGKIATVINDRNNKYNVNLDIDGGKWSWKNSLLTKISKNKVKKEVW